MQKLGPARSHSAGGGRAGIHTRVRHCAQPAPSASRLPGPAVRTWSRALRASVSLSPGPQTLRPCGQRGGRTQSDPPLPHRSPPTPTHPCPPHFHSWPWARRPSHVVLSLSGSQASTQTPRGGGSSLEPLGPHGAVLCDPSTHVHERDPGLRAAVPGALCLQRVPNEMCTPLPSEGDWAEPQMPISCVRGASVHTPVSAKVMRSLHFIPLGRWTGMTVQCALMSCVRSPKRSLWDPGN